MVKRKEEIVRGLAENREIEKMIINITKNNDYDHADLAQDIYMVLLEKESELIEGLYNKKQLNYYIVRIIYNNCVSVNSKYYYRYKKFINNAEQIEKYYDKV